MTGSERAVLVLKYIVRIALLLLLLYLFICSLGLLSDAFRLVGGKQAGLCRTCANPCRNFLLSRPGLSKQRHLDESHRWLDDRRPCHGDLAELVDDDQHHRQYGR